MPFRPPPAVLAFPAGTACDDKLGLETAIPVRFEASRPAEAKLGPPGRCLLRAAAPPTSYAVFRLPGGPAPYSINVSSIVDFGNLVRPKVTLYDANGTVGRTIAPDEFLMGVAGMRAEVRAMGHEAYLVVEADTSALGKRQELKLGEAGFTPYRVAAYGPVMIMPTVATPIPDVVRQREVTFTLNGVVHVSAAPLKRVS